MYVTNWTRPKTRTFNCILHTFSLVQTQNLASQSYRIFQGREEPLTLQKQLAQATVVVERFCLMIKMEALFTP